MTATPSFELNPERLRYILELYQLSIEDFLTLLNKGRKRSILSAQDIDSYIENREPIPVPILKRIDKIFNQGISWYVSKRKLPSKQDSSIFFRKRRFNTDLTLESKKVVNNYEELKFQIQLLSKKIDFKNERLVKKFSIV